MNKIANKKTFALLLSVILVISAISAVMPAIATPLSPDDTEITSALDYLRSAQYDDGNIGSFGTSAWVVMAIAAAGEDPHEWKTAPGNPSIVDYLRDNSDLVRPDVATDWERSILAIVAACEDPTNFGGVDYVAGLKSLWDADNNQMDEPNLLNDDFWGILALVAAGEDPTSEMIQGSADYIKANQDISDGGWSWATPAHTWYSGSDVDDTAAAIMALIAAGESTDSEVITDAIYYLHVEQDAITGGFESWGVVNTASTSWAVDAIVAAGQDPTSADWTKILNNPVDCLLSMQGPLPALVDPPSVAVPEGAFIYCRPDPLYTWPGWEAFEWMTSYAMPALLGKPYPVLCPVIPTIPATVTIEPETLNLNSNGQWVTAYIELPEGYNVEDINVNTTCLDTVPAVNDTQYGFVTEPGSYLMDHDGDGIMERMVKFNRTAVIAYLEEIDRAGDTGNHKLVELSVTGKVAGAPFEGSDTVRVIV